jgi:hypothetical protein
MNIQNIIIEALELGEISLSDAVLIAELSGVLLF